MVAKAGLDLEAVLGALKVPKIRSLILIASGEASSITTIPTMCVQSIQISVGRGSFFRLIRVKQNCYTVRRQFDL